MREIHKALNKEGDNGLPSPPPPPPPLYRRSWESGVKGNKITRNTRKRSFSTRSKTTRCTAWIPPPSKQSSLISTIMEARTYKLTFSSYNKPEENDQTISRSFGRPYLIRGVGVCSHMEHSTSTNNDVLQTILHVQISFCSFPNICEFLLLC